MKTRAAVMLAPGEDWKVAEIDLAPPRFGEVLVEFTHAGLCFSDEHLRHGGLGDLPAVGGHEGAGIIREIGEGVTGLAVGDHVAASFIPTCGRCDWCVSGHSNLCASAANSPGSADPDTFRFSLDGNTIPANCGLGTFARHSVVSAKTVIKVDPEIPLDVVAVVSCGVLTGWGAAVHAAEVRVGDTVVVVGAGGVGINAAQGARFAGAAHIVMVDVNPAKLEFAKRFGSTAEFDSPAKAAEYLWSVNPVAGGADVVIVCTGNTTQAVVTSAYEMLGTRGRLVLAGMSQDVFEPNVHLPGTQIVFREQTIRGTIYGSCNPRHEVPIILDLYRQGRINLDELVSATYRLDDINDGFADLRAGKNLRGVVAHG
ncbi:alcohol dehydrogenase catalytic domain-containing protein [Gordonia desulfuricans]|uniref:Alcohol dehydrogenase catalytic domain-containing protein n=1 Tax=Gordonia desulfuricans TaxID=89051 RepID=A0A7K3LN19_9ACTN|nr:zinc-binding dehydrogenase [Gordonia desulfuricans]NDK89642.1 alcohol dehydrogenase catalytic domain-containing protein [Gordonia desulfuricans]